MRSILTVHTNKDLPNTQWCTVIPIHLCNQYMYMYMYFRVIQWKFLFLLVLTGARFSVGELTPRPPAKSLSLEQDVMFRHHPSNVRSQSGNIEDITITVNGKNCSLVWTFFITLSPILLHLFLTFPRHCPCPLPLKCVSCTLPLQLCYP